MGTIQIIIKILTGNSIKIQIDSYDSVKLTKIRIQQKTNIYPHHQCLVYNGKTLEDGIALIDYGIQDRSTLDLVLRTFDHRFSVCHAANFVQRNANFYQRCWN